MSGLLVDDMDAPWTSSNPAALAVVADPALIAGEGAASNRLTATPGALDATTEVVPGAPVDLSEFEELRFWIRADRRADGSRQRPFYLEFSYDDTGDAPNEEHRWFVPVNRPGVWEQRRVGIEGDRRSAVERFRFRCLTDLPFTCRVDELLAVREELLADLEEALVAHLAGILTVPWLTAIAVSSAAAAGTAQVMVAHTPGFSTGNRILIEGGDAGSEIHDLVGAVHDPVGDTSTLELDPADPLAGNLGAGTASVTLIVPAVIETPPAATVTPSAAAILTHLDLREDLERSAAFTQRDSFRPRGAVTVCSVRSAPRAYNADYQINLVASARREQRHLIARAAAAVSGRSLRIHGARAPMTVLPPPDLDEREPGDRAPVYVRVGSRQEIEPRSERTWAHQSGIVVAQLHHPTDFERIVVEP